MIISMLSRLLKSLPSLVAISAITTVPVVAQDHPPQSILCIGNSFSLHATIFLPQIAAERGHDLVIGHAVIKGGSLAQHADPAATYPVKVEVPPGNLEPTIRFPGLSTDHAEITLSEALNYRPWDVVTIQQASKFSFVATSYEPYATQIIDLIRELQPDAKIYIHQTWAYRHDAPRLRQLGIDQREMHEGLVEAYDRLAADHDLPQIPSGDALNLARQQPMWQYRDDPDFDFDNPPADRLPRQDGSLIRGYFHRMDGKLAIDPYHLNPAGMYLTGCVWYQALFEDGLGGAEWFPEGLTAEQASNLREIAQRAVADSADAAKGSEAH